MEQNNIAFISVRLVGLFLIAANLGYVVTFIGWAGMSPFITQDMGVSVAMGWVNATLSLIPLLAGIVLWLGARKWSRRISPTDTNTICEQYPDIIRAGSFLIGLYLLASNLPVFGSELAQFYYAPQLHNGNEIPPYIEPAILCIFGLAIALSTDVLRELFNRFRRFGR